MTDYAWFSVTGNGETAQTGYAWDGSAQLFTTASDWVDVDASNYPPVTDGTGLASLTPADSLYMFAGSAIGPLVKFYYHPNPAGGYPYLAPVGAGDYTQSEDVLLNSGRVEIRSLGMESADWLAPPVTPTLNIEGAALKIDDGISQSYAPTKLPGFIYPLLASETFLSSQIPGGTIDVGGGGILEVGSTVDPDIRLNFEDSESDTLRFDAGFDMATQGTVDLSGSITDFAQGDTIDFPSLHVSRLLVSTYNGTALYMTFNNYMTLKVDVTGPGLTSASSFHLGTDAAGGVSLTTMCLAAGTRIATPGGERAIETLREGDEVTTLFSGAAPVRWLGRRHVDVARHPDPASVRPLRIKADALAHGVPSRDVLISPDHAIFLEGVLIPVKHLADGAAIAPEPCAEITYYHVELPRHDVLLADGLPAESYLAADNRDSFDNGGATIRLHPDFATRVWEADGCAKLAVTGPEVERVRSRLAQRRLAGRLRRAARRPPARS
jgi:hypothetical protein